MNVKKKWSEKTDSIATCKYWQRRSARWPKTAARPSWCLSPMLSLSLVVVKRNFTLSAVLEYTQRWPSFGTSMCPMTSTSHKAQMMPFTGVSLNRLEELLFHGVPRYQKPEIHTASVESLKNIIGNSKIAGDYYWPLHEKFVVASLALLHGACENPQRFYCRAKGDL